MKFVGKAQVFHITIKQHIQCNRFGLDQSNRNYTKGPLHVGFTFRLYILEGKRNQLQRVIGITLSHIYHHAVVMGYNVILGVRIE